MSLYYVEMICGRTTFVVVALMLGSMISSSLTTDESRNRGLNLSMAISQSVQYFLFRDDYN